VARLSDEDLDADIGHRSVGCGGKLVHIVGTGAWAAGHTTSAAERQPDMELNGAHDLPFARDAGEWSVGRRMHVGPRKRRAARIGRESCHCHCPDGTRPTCTRPETQVNVA